MPNFALRARDDENVFRKRKRDKENSRFLLSTIKWNRPKP